MRSAANNYPSEVARLTARVLDLEERIEWRDRLIADLAAENERLLREMAEAEAFADGPMDLVA